MNIRRIAALAFGASLVGAAAQAQVMGIDGPYVAIQGGWNHSNDLNLSGSGTGLSARAQTSNGYLLGGAAGWAFSPFRVELNLDYRDNQGSSLSVTNPGAFAHLVSGHNNGGDVRSITPTIRGFYDIPYSFLGIVPYVGVGAGAAIMYEQIRDAAGTIVSGDTDAVPAVEGIAGLRYQISSQMSASLQYQFLNAFQPSFGDNSGHTFTTSDYRNSSIVLRLSYSFGAPPPAPPMVAPAAAPAPAPMAQPAPGPRQLFIVFFDFDKSNLTTAADGVLDQASAAFNGNIPVRIEVTGYTDTMGSVKYNIGLSERRADAVRDYLKAHGIPVDRMNVAWKGKTDLRVPTPDQVREPQNRRVEIVFP